jgi:hypothetical protein
MKNILYCIALALLSWSAAEMNAQVTIGDLKNPHNGAVLDLQSTTQGLLFPRVFLNEVKTFQLSTSESDINTATGMVVFNINKDITGGRGKGLYVWFDSQWKPVGNDCCSPTENLDFTVSGSYTVEQGAQITLTATKTIPDNPSWKVSWTVDGSTEYGNISSSNDLTCTVAGIKAGGVVRIQAISSNGIAKIHIVEVTANIASEPCSNSSYLIANGAYEAADPNLSYTGANDPNAILNSGFFRQNGNLCIAQTADPAPGAFGVNWQTANTTCQGIWRLPTLAELAKINSQGLIIFSGTYNMRPDRRFWSSTLAAEGTKHWYLKLNQNTQEDGVGVIPDISDNDTDYTFVRCVRTVN